VYKSQQLRHAYIQKYVPLLQGYGFEIPDDNLRYDDDAGAWVTSDIDWEPLKATMRNGGPDSRRRIANAAANWSDTAWVRRAIEAGTNQRAAA